MTSGTLNYQTAPSLPYKGFRTLSMAQNEANGHYNSLQVDLNSQASKDLQLRAFYTLSRSIDPSTGGSGQDLNPVSNPYEGWRYDLGQSLSNGSTSPLPTSSTTSRLCARARTAW